MQFTREELALIQTSLQTRERYLNNQATGLVGTALGTTLGNESNEIRNLKHRVQSFLLEDKAPITVRSA